MIQRLERDKSQLTVKERLLRDLFHKMGCLTLDDISREMGITRGSASLTLTRFARKVNVLSDRSEWRAPAIYSLQSQNT